MAASTGAPKLPVAYGLVPAVALFSPSMLNIATSHYADCEAAASGGSGVSCHSPVHGASVTSRPDATFSTKNELAFCNSANGKSQTRLLIFIRALRVSSNLHLHSTSSFPKRGSEPALTCRRVFQI